MSSLALRNTAHIQSTQAVKPVPNSDIAKQHSVVSLFPLNRDALETILAQAQEGQVSLTSQGKIDIRYRNLNDADLRGFSLEVFDVTGCSFEGALLDRISLESLLPSARKNKISLRKVNLHGANLEAALLNRKDLGLVSYLPVNLSGVDLEGAVLTSVNMKRAILKGANLKNADCTGANLALVNARDVNFQQVDFTQALLSGGDFRHSDFRGAVFTDARV